MEASATSSKPRFKRLGSASCCKTDTAPCALGDLADSIFLSVIDHVKVLMAYLVLCKITLRHEKGLTDQRKTHVMLHKQEHSSWKGQQKREEQSKSLG